MLPVDKCTGHKCTKWQPARFYHFWVSGRVMKALLSRVTRELWACLARKRYRRRSNPDLWSTGIRGSALPFPAAGRGGDPEPPEAPPSCPARGPAPAGSRPGQPSLPPRQPLMWLPTSQGARVQTPRPVPSRPFQPGQSRAATPGVTAPPAPGSASRPPRPTHRLRHFEGCWCSCCSRDKRSCSARLACAERPARRRWRRKEPLPATAAAQPQSAAAAPGGGLSTAGGARP